MGLETFAGAAGALGGPTWAQRGSGAINRDGSGRAVAGAADSACFVTHTTPTAGLAQRVRLRLSLVSAQGGEEVSAIVRADASGPLDCVSAQHIVSGNLVILNLRTNGSHAGELTSWFIGDEGIGTGQYIDIEVDGNPTAPTFTLRHPVTGTVVGVPWTWDSAAAAPQGQHVGFQIYAFAGTTQAGIDQWEVIDAGSPSLEIQTPPAGAVVGQAFTTQPVIRFLDATGVLDTAASAQVTATIVSGTGTILGTAARTPSSGVATYTGLGITGAVGAHTVRFSAPGYGSVDVAVTVAAGAAAKLAVLTQPGSAASGQAFGTQPVIEIQDANGFRVTGSSASVTVAKQSGSGTLGGTLTVAAVNGVATFTNLAITGSGAHTLRFTSGALTLIDSASVTVTAAPTATSLAFQTQPSGAVDNVAFTQQPVVRVLDQFGVLMTSASGSVTITKQSGSGTLVGTTAATLVNGVATFAGLKIQGTGAHTLRATYNAITADSTSFTVAAGVGPATKLRMVRQPAGAVLGLAFTTQPQVEVLDANNNRVTASTVAITAAVLSGSGAVIGTVTVNAVSGLATWTTLGIGTAPGAHTLRFTSSGLTPADSASFTVVDPGTGNAATGYVYAIPKNVFGDAVEGATVTGASSNTAVATVGAFTEVSPGLYRALVTSAGLGSCTITPTCDGKAGTPCTVVVSAPA